MSSKGNSIARCRGLPLERRYKANTVLPYTVLRWVRGIRVRADGTPRSKSYKSIYGRTPRRLRKGGAA